MNRIVKSNSDIVRAGLILLCTLVMASNAFAGVQVAIEGVVRCESDGEPIEGVEVLVTSLLGERASATTDEDGYYLAFIDLDNPDPDNDDPVAYQLTFISPPPDGTLLYITDYIDYATSLGETNITLDCEPQCQECRGKITQLTLQYTGSDSAFIMVFQKKLKNPIAGFLAESGDIFTVNGQDKDSTLGTEISLYVVPEGESGDDPIITKIHTSCSQPIGPGMVFGDFLVTGGYSKDGGLLCPEETSCECDGKVTVLELEYSGLLSADIQIIQKKGDVQIYPPLDPPLDENGNPLVTSITDPGTVFTITGEDDKGTMGTEISVYINEQETKVHTSCSQPIGAGMTIGDDPDAFLTIVKGYSLKGGLLCDYTAPQADEQEDTSTPKPKKPKKEKKPKKKK